MLMNRSPQILVALSLLSGLAILGLLLTIAVRSGGAYNMLYAYYFIFKGLPLQHKGLGLPLIVRAKPCIPLFTVLAPVLAFAM